MNNASQTVKWKRSRSEHDPVFQITYHNNFDQLSESKIVKSWMIQIPDPMRDQS